MTEEQCLAVLKDWQEQFFQKRGMSIDAFVWDDGWDAGSYTHLDVYKRQRPACPPSAP